MRISGRQLSLTILAAAFLLAAIFIFAVFAFAPEVAGIYQPFLLTSFIVALFISLVAIAWLLRGILRPYNQLISEAERVPVARSGKTQNEAAFVLETFQSVVAQLQAQQQELERLTAEASQRADSAELFSERIVASMPTGLIAFDLSGKATVANAPAHVLSTATPDLRATLSNYLRRRARLWQTWSMRASPAVRFSARRNQANVHRNRSGSAQPSRLSILRRPVPKARFA